MGSHLIVTTAWWADTHAGRAWPWLANASAWPLWWTCIAHIDMPAAEVPEPRPWRAALGLRLRLAAGTMASQPPQWMTLRLQGDLQGQATFALEPDAHNGLHITCRWELLLPANALLPWPALLEHGMRHLLRTMVVDFGRALPCRVRVLGSWQGSRHNGPAGP